MSNLSPDSPQDRRGGGPYRGARFHAGEMSHRWSAVVVKSVGCGAMWIELSGLCNPEQVTSFLSA